MASPTHTPRHPSFRQRATARMGIVVALVSLLTTLTMAPATTVALEDGHYVMQCFCPVDWEAPWDGNGVFDNERSLDTIALANGTAVVLMHEVPVNSNTVEGMMLDRSDAVLAFPRTAGPVIVWEEARRGSAEAGRVWTTPDGVDMGSFQYVQVWETNYLLSIEFIAPLDEFEDAWLNLDGILLVGLPLLGDFDGGDILAELTA